MQVPVSEAKAQLTELVRRAEAGEEIVLTRRGRPTVRLVRERQRLQGDELRRAVDELSAAALAKATPGPCAARSQDFLYDEDGLPA